MDTIIVKPTQNEIKRAANIILQSGIVAIPTETVYGLGANALDKSAVEKIFLAKGRPMDNPLIIHIGRKNDIYKYAKNISSTTEKLIDEFWPGPLTVVLQKKSIIPDEITGGLSTVAIRMPANEVALALIRQAGVPIAAPSANVSGKPSPTKACHVKDDLNGKISLILDGGSCEVGVESTVVDVSGEKVAILRPGKITKEMIERFVKVDSVMENASKSEVPKAPGMKYAHYSPKAKITIYDGKREDVLKQINTDVHNYSFKGIKVGVIIESEYKSSIVYGNVYDIGCYDDEHAVAKNLFSILRQLDDDDIEVAFIPMLKSEHIGKATMNRLLKAAAYNLKTV